MVLVSFGSMIGGAAMAASPALPEPLARNGAPRWTIKEGMYDHTMQIMVVDKSVAIAVNSNTRLGSLNG
jgi:hypothetical protein